MIKLSIALPGDLCVHVVRCVCLWAESLSAEGGRRQHRRRFTERTTWKSRAEPTPRDYRWETNPVNSAVVGGGAAKRAWPFCSELSPQVHRGKAANWMYNWKQVWVMRHDEAVFSTPVSISSCVAALMKATTFTNWLCSIPCFEPHSWTPITYPSRDDTLRDNFRHIRCY